MTTKQVIFSVFIMFLISCADKHERQLSFLGKNAYQEPVWEEMMLQETVNYEDVQRAFDAYKSTHNLSASDLKHFQKMTRRLNLDFNDQGIAISKQKQYNDLQEWRALPATPQEQAEIADQNFRTTIASYAMDIPNLQGEGDWTNVGPFGNPDVRWTATGNGALDHVEMHPTNPAIMYVSARNGGLWKTINSGTTWTPLTDHFATPHVSRLEINRANPSILYMGTKQDQKIYYSSDGGRTWVNRSSGLQGRINDIISNPTDPSKVLAAKSNGLFYSADSGSRWVRKKIGRYTDIRETNTWDLLIVGNDLDNIAPSIFFSKDGGDTWLEETVTDEYETVDKFYFGIHNTATKVIYAYGIKGENGWGKPTSFIGLWKASYNANPGSGKHFGFKRVTHPTYTYPDGPRLLEKDGGKYKPEDKNRYGGINLSKWSVYL